MIESLLPRLVKTGRPGINLDWKDLAIGSKEVSDKCGNLWQRFGANTASGVILDSVKGNVFEAKGDVYFTTPVTELLYLSKKSFVIEFEVLPKTTASVNLGGTGDYNQGISSGIGINLGQFYDRFFQAFLMGPGTQYDRLYAPVQYSPEWTKVEITRTYGSGFWMNVYRGNSTRPIAAHSTAEIEIGNGSGVWNLFRGANTPSNYFVGLVNYFKLTYI